MARVMEFVCLQCGKRCCRQIDGEVNNHPKCCSRECYWKWKTESGKRNADARFWLKISKKDPESCWEWIAKSETEDGYGVFYHHSGEPAIRSHRFSWGLVNGAIPEGKSVLHRCNNRKCCNPNHLYLGTSAENMADKARANSGKGERHGLSKLTDMDVVAIRGMYKSGDYLQKEIATIFGVSSVAISCVCRRKTWAHIA